MDGDASEGRLRAAPDAATAACPGSSEPLDPEARELCRLDALYAFGVLDTEPEQDFDDLTALAASLCNTPIAGISLVDADRQWFKSRLGDKVVQTTLSTSICVHAMRSPGTLVVPDLTLDERFASYPQVTREDRPLRFYAGAPLTTADGYVLGTLCVLDLVPRRLDALQLGQLEALARQVVSQLELRRQAHQLAEEVASRTVAEAALRDSQRLLDGVLAHTDVVVFAKDLSGRYLLANDAFGKLVGASGASLVGLTAHDLFPPEEAATYVHHDAQVASSGSHESFTEHGVHADGSVHEYLSTRFPLRDDDGAVYAVAGVATDISELSAERTARAESEQALRAAHDELEARRIFTDALLDSVQVGIVACDAEGNVTVFNDVTKRWHGTDRGMADRHISTAPGPEPVQLLDGEGRRLRLDDLPLLRALTDGVVEDVEMVISPHVGRPTRVTCSGRSLSTADGRPLGAVVAMTDITAARAQTSALQASEQRFRATFANDPAGLAIVSASYQALQVNAALCRLLRSTEAELLGLTDLLSLICEADRTAFLDLAGRAVADPGATLSTERQLRLADGRELWVQLTVTGLPGPEGEDSCLLVQVEDIDDRKSAELRLTHQALHDSLTGLPNRLLLLDRAERALARRARHPSDGSVAALFCDLDGFKAVNDRHGHAAGDHLLVEIGRRLSELLRSTDTVARLGGDEFVLLCDRLGSVEEASQIARRVEQLVAQPVAWGDADMSVTTSVGIAVAEHATSAQDLVRSADMAMYEVKRRSRHRTREPRG